MMDIRVFSKELQRRRMTVCALYSLDLHAFSGCFKLLHLMEAQIRTADAPCDRLILLPAAQRHHLQKPLGNRLLVELALCHSLN